MSTDLVDSLREAIAAQRETIAAKTATIEDLRERCRRLIGVLAACPSCSNFALRGERL